jgi:hypothetical protein
MGKQGTSSARGKASASGSSSVRKPSPAVYRRRRLVVGGALLMVLALVVGGFALAIAFSGGSEQASSTDPASSSASAVPSAPTTESASASAAPTPTASATPSCNQNLVTVSASTDKAAYGPDENPLLTLKVTNGGEVPCQVNIGTSQMEFLVTSGPDRVFSSRDCQAASEDLVKVIAPKPRTSPGPGTGALRGARWWTPNRAPAGRTTSSPPSWGRRQARRPSSS